MGLGTEKDFVVHLLYERKRKFRETLSKANSVITSVYPLHKDLAIVKIRPRRENYLHHRIDLLWQYVKDKYTVRMTCEAFGFQNQGETMI